MEQRRMERITTSPYATGEFERFVAEVQTALDKE